MKGFARIISMVSIAALALACYEDKSTEATFEIPEISVVSEEYPGDVINIAYGQTLEISVTVTQEGRTEDDFTYYWEVDLTAGSVSSGRLELGDSSAISYQVASSPSDTPYTLSVQVVDLQTGYGVYKYWNMYVVSSLGEGLLVAHTRDGGQTSELDLLACDAVTYGYEGESATYTRDLFALANDGEPISGVVNSLTARVASNGAVYNESRIILGTDSHIYSLDPLTYSVDKTDSELFNLTTETEFPTSLVFNYAAYFSGAIINNSLYGAVCNSDNSYSLLSFNVSPSNVFYPTNIAYTKQDQGVVSVFNENNSTFYYIYGWMSLSGSFASVDWSPSFTLDGSTSLGAGGVSTSSHGYLLKDASGGYHYCLLEKTNTGMSCTDYDIVPTDVDNAVDFAFCDNSSLFYYATPDAIYSVLLSGENTTVSKLTWTPDSSDEKITMIEQYHQGWYGTHQYYLGDYEFTLSTNRLQIIIVTYNETTGEGKIYLRPFNVSTGRFTYSDNGTYDGFGEITAVGCTLR